jgi:hypothetical protein
MHRFAIGFDSLMLIACADTGPELPAVGEACDAEGQCAEGLSCVHLVCADDRGPEVTVLLPESLQPFGEDSSMTAVAHVGDAIEGDQLEWILDPGSSSPHRELVAVSDGRAESMLSLPAPLTVGSHHLRARLVDADGTPYPNPSASAEVVVFVPDPVIPDTPQLAIVWPPHGHVHRLGNPLEIEVVVLPNSFEITDYDGSDTCQPVPDCVPAFDPSCQDQCGAVSREGHVKIFMEPDYPNCLLDQPIGCNGSYIAVMRPGDDGDTVIGASQIRSLLETKTFFQEPGTVSLTAALSYHDHNPYPNDTAIVYETLNLVLRD